jgi:pimeloyl-ACP methyl ester carboxylesterase
MGGYISQRLAIAQPERVRSLTAIMSTTGAPDLPKTRPDVTARLFAPPPATREEKIARMLELNRAICANAADFSETRLLEKMTLSEQRGHDPIAVARQMAALLAGGSTDAGLRQLRTPALVMHGALDPLLPVGCGLRIHECLEGSKLWIDENLGHYLAARVIEPMTERISELTAASDAADR